MTLPVATRAAGAVRLAYDLLGATLDTGSFPSHLWGVGQFSPSLWRQTVTLGLSNSASTSLDAARACCTSCKGLTGENQLWGSQTPTTRPSVPAGAPGSPQRPLLRRLPSTGAGLSGLTVPWPALPQRPLPQEERASAWTALPFCSLPPLPRVMCPLASACSSQACFFLF